MKNLRLISILPALLLVASCGADSGSRTSTSTPVRKKFSERMNEDGGFKQDSKGNWTAQSNRRSQYESVGQDPNFTRKGVDKKEYKTGDYAKQSFWGSKEYDRKSYTGNTDGSRFQSDSRFQGQNAREGTSTANLKQDYKTGSYATGDAREAGQGPARKPDRDVNDLIENQQDNFNQPEIIDWREHRKMTIEQSKGLLGN